MAQLIASGIIVGSIYALVALSFTVVYRVTGVLNFAQGELLTVAGVVAYISVSGFSLPIPIAALLAVIAVIIVSLLIDRLAVRSLWFMAARRSNYSWTRVIGHGWLLTTFGVSLIIQQTVSLMFGDEDLPAPALFGSDVFTIAGARITAQEISIVVAAIVIVVALELFYAKTKAGKQGEAVAENPNAAALSGISVSRVITVSWIIGGLVTGIVGVLVAPVLVLSAHMGFGIMIKAFIAVIIGGIGSVRGAILAGYLIGLYEYTMAILIPGGMVQVSILLLLIVVLIFKPTGLFGKTKLVRA